MVGKTASRGQAVTERDDLLASIANTIRDYRAGEIMEPTPSHVDRWISQFDGDAQVPMLRELDFVFKRTYVSKIKAQQLLETIVAGFPCDFWRAAHILDIQEQGSSQSEILRILSIALKEKCGSDIEYEGSTGGAFVYLDDAIFTGNRVVQDISNWMRIVAPKGAQVYIMTIAAHESGRYWINVNKNMNDLKLQKQINVRMRCFNGFIFESRRAYRNQSDVLWPIAGVYDSESFQPRIPQKTVSRVFSSEQGRQFLEREFLNSGLKIQGFASYPSPMLKPLGFSPFGPGFGSLFVTFRNCPNNCPLALWYGDPSSYPENHPLGRWYPLFPRKGYSL